VLFHVSDRGDIEHFEPRVLNGGPPLVWAIDAVHLCNYLLPRDCPRVTFGVGSNGTPGDIAQLLGPHQRVVAIEAGWEQRVREATVFVYDMPPAPFVLADANAGYWTSPTPVTPLSRRPLTALPQRIAEHGATLVVLPSLWPLHDAAAASSLEYSMIRMRNATPR
jgi:hypothetical protein